MEDASIFIAELLLLFSAIPELYPLSGFDCSNSLGFPKPAGPRPETRLAGYKRKRAINRTFPFQCSHDAASPDGAASPRRRRLRAEQWELLMAGRTSHGHCPFATGDRHPARRPEVP